ncbi:uncharacterized protein LOC121376179 isoform X2 [Gigantopelta aegis]|uniref:uncharacterized protein LOC121376179 isoform X2 n=1 Tax=Gigantopelta aegis TaxID=1735272 RepID=UPI001B889BFB|nr:uncharacterized protein LOC121376179 isoform X2 [Gigantopelta aegis]
MTTGHILPGFCDPVSRLARAKTAGYPVNMAKLLEKTSVYSKIDPLEFKRIKEDARRMWCRPRREPTTYDFFYNSCSTQFEKPPETVPRPSSPTRLNKPHPPNVFLTNRLHYIDGFQNPDTIVGKGCYRVDDCVPDQEYGQRRCIREKYDGQPSTESVNVLMDKYGLTEYLDPIESQAAESWLNIADDDDKHHLSCALQSFREKQIYDQHKIEFRPRVQPKVVCPPSYNWIRPTLPKETECIYHSDKYETKPYNTVVSTLGERKKKHFPLERGLPRRYTSQLLRGEFMMHPDWPETIPHHRIP